MIPIKGIVTCVGYDDFLSISLQRNARHMTEVLVITSSTDYRTIDIVKNIPSAKIWITDAFTRNGAKFNKGAAVEEGFNIVGRDGWILLFDADIILPNSLPLYNLDSQKMYGAPRRLLHDITQYRDGLNWSSLSMSNEVGYPGYFQLFNGSARSIIDRPWYDTSFIHAGGGDGYFDSKWPEDRKEKLPMEVLHLGHRDLNWFGRAAPRHDGIEVDSLNENRNIMMRFLRSRGWGVQRVEENFNERVQ